MNGRTKQSPPSTMLCARSACAKPAAEQMIDATSKQVIAHVCSQQCGYALIGMPKRAAEDDAGQEETPHERAMKAADNVANIAKLLERIARAEKHTRAYFVTGDSSERLAIITRLQLPIGAGITPGSLVVEKLVEIRDYLVDKLNDAVRGFDIDYDAIRSRITSLRNQLADDETLDRYIYMHDPMSLRNLLPTDAQRIIARQTFPIQIVSEFIAPEENTGTLFAAVALPSSVVLYYQKDQVLTMVHVLPDGEKFNEYTFQNVPEFAYTDTTTLLVQPWTNSLHLQDSPLLNGNVFTLDLNGSWCAIPGTKTVFFLANDSSTPQFFNNNASKDLVNLLTVPTVWKTRRTAHCFARNNIVAIVDRSNKVRVFDLQNDTQVTLTKLRLPDIDSVTIDDKSHIWVSHQTSLAIFTRTGEEITTDNLTNNVPFDLLWGNNHQPSFLSAAGSLVWLVYQENPFHPDDYSATQVVGLRLTPESLIG